MKAECLCQGSMSARRRASPYGTGRPIRWGTVSNGRISNASRLPWTALTAAVTTSTEGVAVASQSPPAAHSSSPRGNATLQPSSSSSLASLPFRRYAAPPLERYTRGHRDTAFAIASDPAQLQAAIEDLEALRYSASALAGRRSRQNLWTSVVQQAQLGDPTKPTAGMVFAVVAVLRQAGYRSASSVAEQAVLTARLNNQPVGAAVSIALRDARRAATRGLGPPRQSAPIPVDRLFKLTDHQTPLHPLGPLWPRSALVVGAWWVTREVELANIAQQDVTVSRTEASVSILLSASKTDPTALGEVRTHRCACGSVPNAPAVFRPELCPYCTVTGHLEQLALHNLASPAWPLFPQASGLPASKKGMVATIVTAAHLLGLPTQSASGAQLFGGHSLRVGGIQFLGRCGVEVARIQVLARHSTNATVRYLQGVHAQAMHNLAAEAGYNRSLDSLRAELKLLQSRVRAPSAPPEPTPCHRDTRARSVWNPGPSSRLHFTKPDDSSRTLCGWLWPSCLKSVPDPPPDCAPVCAKCRTTFTAAPFTTIDAGASQSSTSSSSSSTS